MSYELNVKTEKAKEVENLRGRMEQAGAVLVSEYRGLTVGQLGLLREQLADAEAEYTIVKNTLARLAARALGFEELAGEFVGPSAVTYVHGDPVAAAKALSKFAELHPALVMRGGVLDGRMMSASETQRLAKVEPLEVSLSKICGSLTAPLAAMVGTLQAPLQRIAYVLEQRAVKGE